MQAAHAAAPGKVILFGEHAVVYGKPAIAVPLAAVQAAVQATPADSGAGMVIHALDLNETIRVTAAGGEGVLYDALAHPARLALEALGHPIPDLTLKVQSTIPIASGLGSGAAIAAAIVRAVAQACGAELPRERVNALVYEVERRHHGTPSGIDNTVIVYEQPVYFKRGEPLETFHIKRPFTLLVADSGQPSPTRIAVTDVRVLYEKDQKLYQAVFDGIGDVAEAARRAIESGDIAQLGPLMHANQALLRRLTVSSATLDSLCEAAEAAGAWGAKLSGGGRGGNIIAVVDPAQASTVTDALYEAGAVRVIETTVEATGQGAG